MKVTMEDRIAELVGTLNGMDNVLELSGIDEGLRQSIDHALGVVAEIAQLHRGTHPDSGDGGVPILVSNTTEILEEAHGIGLHLDRHEQARALEVFADKIGDYMDDGFWNNVWFPAMQHAIKTVLIGNGRAGTDEINERKPGTWIPSEESN